MSTNAPHGLTIEIRDAGAIWRVTLSTPPGNILDRDTIDALAALFARARRDTGLKCVVIDSEGAHFSFGASIQEHFPDQCAHMLASFRTLLRAMLDSAVPVLAVVRGQCLGGGLELAAFCQRVFAAPDARLGQPEIKLGVFAPFASFILPERMGRGGAEDLLLSGRSIAADEAHRGGLVDEIHAHPGDAALAYARTHLLPLSGSSLRHAVRAARLELAARFDREMPRLESAYVNDLMRTHDAREGLQAFLDKRPPAWKHR